MPLSLQPRSQGTLYRSVLWQLTSAYPLASAPVTTETWATFPFFS